MTSKWLGSFLALSLLGIAGAAVAVGPPAAPLGLPPVAAPADNPAPAEKIALGKKLFEETRFSSTGKVACANCHATDKAFTDSPLTTSLGINDLTGTRNSPTLLNAANTHPETYPKFQKQLGRVIALRDMINWCLRNPLEGQPLALDDPKMIALEAYVAYERRGVPLVPGKH